MLRAIIRSVALYLDIEEVRTIKIIAGLLGTSLLLQLITVTTPGWIVTKNVYDGKVEDYVALMYYVRCDEEGCKTYPVPKDEYGRDWSFQYVTSIVEGLVPILFCSVSIFLFIFSLRKPKWREPFFLFCTWILGMANGQFKYVSWIVEGLVPILFCSVSLFLFLFSLRKPKWREPFFLFCTWILGMATVLQWDLMAPFADMHKMVTAGGGLENYPVPWNVILHSFSAFMTTTVMLASLVILMKKLIGNVMANDRMEEQFMTNPDQTEAGVHV